MADVRTGDDIVSQFLLDTCAVRQWWINCDVLQALFNCDELATKCDDDGNDMISLITGSAAEFYIQPMLSCVGDVDIMYHYGDELAIPARTAPPTQLPGEFHSRVEVSEIFDSEFAGYVYLVRSYILTECINDGKYKAVQVEQRRCLTYPFNDKMHGPAFATDWSCKLLPHYGRLADGGFSRDRVYCMRCLLWPTQAVDWPTRHRDYDWPDSATIDRVISNGCDVVCKTHRLYEEDKRTVHTPFRLSFSRAEIMLLNSWIPVQQIVYHVLRVFVKTKRLTDSANSDVTLLSNYHIKTLMLWACEVKPSSWWIDDLNVVGLGVELLQILGDWMSDEDACCPHYFIHCNLFDHPYSCYSAISSRLMSETEASLTDWFVSSYIPKCAKVRPPGYPWPLRTDISNFRKLQETISALVDRRLKQSQLLAPCTFTIAQFRITSGVSCRSLTVRSCLW